MQTFLPYSDFARCAQALDYKRLGKQRVECKQIMLALTTPDYGWRHHPAVRMWRGYEMALCWYSAHMCVEWKKRGYTDNLLPFFDRLYTVNTFDMPPWMGDERVHSSHRANLIRKDPVYYLKHGWTEAPQDGYYWPV